MAAPLRYAGGGDMTAEPHFDTALLATQANSATCFGLALKNAVSDHPHAHAVPLLGAHFDPPAAVVARLDHGRCARIHRHRLGTVPRLPDRAALLLPARHLRVLHRAAS